MLELTPHFLLLCPAGAAGCWRGCRCPEAQSRCRQGVRCQLWLMEPTAVCRVCPGMRIRVQESVCSLGRRFVCFQQRAAMPRLSQWSTAPPPAALLAAAAPAAAPGARAANAVRGAALVSCGRECWAGPGFRERWRSGSFDPRFRIGWRAWSRPCCSLHQVQPGLGLLPGLVGAHLSSSCRPSPPPGCSLCGASLIICGMGGRQGATLC